MGRSRIRKIKTTTNTYNNQPETNDVFFMNLEEAKAAIADKYEFLDERRERYPKNKRLS